MVDRAHSFISETSVTGGTGDQLLAGAFDGSYRTFSSKYADGDRGFFLLKQGVKRELVYGTYIASGNKIGRTDVIGGTNGTSLVNFDAGQAIQIFDTMPAPGDLSSAQLMKFLALLGAVGFAGSQSLSGGQQGQAQTNLGISTFIKTLLDDADGAAAWSTLGAATNNATNGYFKIPSGLIVQYGMLAQGSGVSDSTLNFPLSFPNGCRAVIIVPVYNNVGSSEIALCNVSSIGVSSCSVRSRYILGTGGPIATSAMTHNWIAIGY